MQLDHVTIVAHDCAPLLRFLVGIAGMEQGARPAFGVGGHWLYLDGRPVLHLIERPAGEGAARERRVPPPARIDHLALRVGGAAEWRALLERLHAARVPYQLSDMRISQELQLFVALAPEVTVEFVIAAHALNSATMD